MSNLQKLKARAFENKAVRKHYDSLEEEFDLVSKLLDMRISAGLTQEDVAVRMSTKKSNICRLEKGNTNPSWKTIHKYAKACGFTVNMQFENSN